MVTTKKAKKYLLVKNSQKTGKKFHNFSCVLLTKKGGGTLLAMKKAKKVDIGKMSSLIPYVNLVNFSKCTAIEVRPVFSHRPWKK